MWKEGGSDGAEGGVWKEGGSDGAPQPSASPHRHCTSVTINNTEARYDNASHAHRSIWCSVSSEPERSRLRSSKNSNGDILPEGAPPEPAQAWGHFRVGAARACGRVRVPGGGGFDDCITILR